MARGRVLAARRVAPPAAAGRWELPGGKVEPGETPEQALTREIAEELGCRIGIDRWLVGESTITSELVLRVALAHLLDGRPEPGPGDHDEVRWLAAGELASVDWLESDLPFLGEVEMALADAAPAVDLAGARGIFFDADTAHDVARLLTAAGWQAQVSREPFAGEDDDEDHPWAVTTDAPEFQLELLVDEHDGWLDHDEPAPPPLDGPLRLPDGPRRHHRPPA